MTPEQSYLTNKLEFWRKVSNGLGVAVTVLLFSGVRDMVDAFDHMGLTGGSDPGRLAEDISAAVVYVWISAAAIPFLIFSMIKRYQLNRSIKSMKEMHTGE